jgi:cyclopropane-fatty-acyl-phospholipid synthase
MLDRLAERLVRARLRRLRQGQLTLIDGKGLERFGRASGLEPLAATVQVHDPRFWAEVAFGGAVGAGEAYMQGFWSTDDLTAVVRLLLRDREALDGLETGLARLAAPARRALHWLNRNTRAGARRNIAAHYDVGNDFFALVLDPTMMYSCAIFEDPAMSLEQAQRARLDAICRKLDLRPTDHLLEIGTGWGGMAIHAARHYGCRVTTTTISRAQYDLARARIDAAGLADRITLRLKDYRDLTGTYDKLVSIEMIEAIGHELQPDFFARCASLLADDGIMLLQAITIADQRYDQARRSVDFIRRHVFPGSTIPSVTAMLAAATRASDLRVAHLEDIGPHYATTLARWRDNLHANLEAVRALGYQAEFVRLWEYYLCYCEERALSDVQMLMVKPGNRRPLPATRTVQPLVLSLAPARAFPRASASIRPMPR